MMTAERVLAAIDPIGLAALRRRYGGVDLADDDHRRDKYLDLEYWLGVNLKRVERVGLNSGKRRRVLDLGCGCGYFLFVCKLLGHDVMGIDRPERDTLYTAMRELLEVPVTPHTVRPFEPLPVRGYDVVTAHMVCFNGHRRSPWGPQEWAFLLDDLDASLVCLELNAEPDGTLYPPGVRELFDSRGAKIVKHRVLIDRR